MEKKKDLIREKASTYYHNNKGKYKEYYQRNKERLLQYQKEHNKIKRMRNIVTRRKNIFVFNIEYKPIILTFD